MSFSTFISHITYIPKQKLKDGADAKQNIIFHLEYIVNVKW